MATPKALKAIRLVHHYSGVFFAPAILFFAITGSLQMFGLHETSRGSSYVPPAFLVRLSQLHKKGTIDLPQRRPATSAAGKTDSAKPDVRAQQGTPPVAATPAASPVPPRHNSLPMKIFFALTGAGLVISTCTGLFMAWKYTRRKAVFAAVVLAGVVIPLLLLAV
jgi:hypothetical protein